MGEWDITRMKLTTDFENGSTLVVELPIEGIGPVDIAGSDILSLLVGDIRRAFETAYKERVGPKQWVEGGKA